MAMDKIKNCMKVTSQEKCISGALLVLRIIMGIAFIMHGWGKIQSPFSWMGPDAPVPGILLFLAAISEFGGGIALILGLLTRLASLGLMITMIVAALFHFLQGDPFVASGPGQSSYELAAVYAAISFLFLMIGPGKFSADSKVFGSK